MSTLLERLDEAGHDDTQATGALYLEAAAHIRELEKIVDFLPPEIRNIIKTFGVSELSWVADPQETTNDEAPLSD
jgi:hypothetical protein